MKMIGTVLMTLTRIGVFLIASPLMLIQLIMGLGVATLGATMANMLVQLWLTNLLGDSGFFSGVIRIGVFVLLYLVAWVTVAMLWASPARPSEVTMRRIGCASRATRRQMPMPARRSYCASIWLA